MTKRADLTAPQRLALSVHLHRLPGTCNTEASRSTSFPVLFARVLAPLNDSFAGGMFRGEQRAAQLALG